MITLKAPKPTAAEAKSLKEKREPLVAALSDLAERDAKVRELRKKEASTEKKAAGLHHRAAAYDLDAETQLASTLKQIADRPDCDGAQSVLSELPRGKVSGPSCAGR